MPDMRKVIVSAFALLAALQTGCTDTVDAAFYQGMPLKCDLSAPQDTVVGYERCLLEQWQPCRIERTGSEPSTTILHYDSGRLAEEERMGFQPAIKGVRLRRFRPRRDEPRGLSAGGSELCVLWRARGRR